MVTSRNKDNSSITSLTTFVTVTDWNYVTRNMVWVSQSVKLFFWFFSHRQKTHAQGRPHSPLINYTTGDRKKALGAKISGNVFGWTSVNDWSMCIQRRPLTNNWLCWLRTRSRICLPLKFVWCRHLLRLAKLNTLVLDSELSTEAHSTAKYKEYKRKNNW